LKYLWSLVESDDDDALRKEAILSLVDIHSGTDWEEYARFNVNETPENTQRLIERLRKIP